MNEEKVLAILNRVFRIDEEMNEINNQYNKVKRDYDNEFAEHIRKYSREPEEPYWIAPNYGDIRNKFKRKNMKKEADLNYQKRMEQYKRDMQDYERRKAEDPVHAFPPELRGRDKQYRDWFEKQKNKYSSLADEKNYLLEQSGIVSEYLNDDNALEFIKRLLEQGEDFKHIYRELREQRYRKQENYKKDAEIAELKRKLSENQYNSEKQSRGIEEVNEHLTKLEMLADIDALERFAKGPWR